MYICTIIKNQKIINIMDAMHTKFIKTVPDQVLMKIFPELQENDYNPENGKFQTDFYNDVETKWASLTELERYDVFHRYRVEYYNGVIAHYKKSKENVRMICSAEGTGAGIGDLAIFDIAKVVSIQEDDEYTWVTYLDDDGKEEEFFIFDFYFIIGGRIECPMGDETY